MRALLLTTCLALSSFALAGCETETAATIAVTNEFAMTADGGVGPTTVTIYRVWFAPTLLDEPVVPGATSDALRTVPGSDYAYALLAPGWDPAAGGEPTTLVPVRSKEKLTTSRGAELTVHVNDGAFVGRCGFGGSPLAQVDAEFIVQRVFPGAFAGKRYDAATCGTVMP